MSADIVLRIDGMHCGACIRRVTQALNGVAETQVGEVRVGAARVHTPDNAETRQALIDSLAKAGFKAHVED